ncbi:hypothetical protein KBC25_01965 [Candidatus Pacearchaeota archaeon]|jgi:hypothetical protein|nr:hypothetical protein [Candidatus Pacearchaeota archaeon]
MKNLGYLPYHRIRKESTNSLEYHDHLIDLVCLGRWRLEDEADMKLEAGLAYSPSTIKEKARVMNNLAVLKGYDAYLESILPKFKKSLMGALLN